MSGKDINGRAVAAGILAGVVTGATELKKNGWSPRLVSIRIGENHAVDLYVRNQRRTADKGGIASEEKQHFRR